MSRNIVITGTPGTGKSTLGKELSKRIPGSYYLDLGKEIKEQKLYSEWDDEMNASIFDEDLVIAYVETVLQHTNGIILDFHSIGWMDEKLSEKFHACILLKTSTEILYDRLLARGYHEDKIKENVECEIFQMSLEEAMESFPENKIMCLQNDTIEDAHKNIQAILNIL
jgi:adenylate kinase